MFIASFSLRALALYEGPSPAVALFPIRVNAAAIAIITIRRAMIILYVFFIVSPIID